MPTWHRPIQARPAPLARRARHWALLWALAKSAPWKNAA